MCTHLLGKTGKKKLRWVEYGNKIVLEQPKNDVLLRYPEGFGQGGFCPGHELWVISRKVIIIVLGSCHPLKNIWYEKRRGSRIKL